MSFTSPDMNVMAYFRNIMNSNDDLLALTNRYSSIVRNYPTLPDEFNDEQGFYACISTYNAFFDGLYNSMLEYMKTPEFAQESSVVATANMATNFVSLITDLLETSKQTTDYMISDRGVISVNAPVFDGGVKRPSEIYIGAYNACMKLKNAIVTALE